MPFQRKHFLAASQMEAHRRVEVTGVLAENVELGGGTQRSGMGVARAHGERRGRVISA
jgi:hypothetical protein